MDGQLYGGGKSGFMDCQKWLVIVKQATKSDLQSSADNRTHDIRKISISGHI
jgi:hypothetical protein